MACRLLVGLLSACPWAALAGGSSEFLPRHGSAEEGASCVADQKPCVDGVDCCGVCAYIGASTWQCQACTPPGEECIPMGNRCCDGGNKQKDIPQEHPQHSCQATNEVSKKYGTTKYTCQSTASQAPAALAASAKMDGRNGSKAASVARQSIAAKVLHIGDATADQLRAVLGAAPTCFDRHPVDTSSLVNLQGSLGAAVACVQDEMEKAWGWRPFVDVEGSASCGQCDGYGLGATVVEVVTDSGNWMFVMRLK